MPKFFSELVYPTLFSQQQRKRIGKLYEVEIAPPGNRSGEPSWPAFFDPESQRTILGSEALELLDLDQLADDAEVHLYLRDLGGTEDTQLRLTFTRADLEEAKASLGGKWVQIGFDVIENHLRHNWQHQSYFALPGYLELIDRDNGNQCNPRR